VERLPPEAPTNAIRSVLALNTADGHGVFACWSWCGMSATEHMKDPVGCAQSALINGQLTVPLPHGAPEHEAPTNAIRSVLALNTADGHGVFACWSWRGMSATEHMKDLVGCAQSALINGQLTVPLPHGAPEHEAVAG
jgi:hypothetical protein